MLFALFGTSSNKTPPGLTKHHWKYITHCGGAETPVTSARRKWESRSPRLKVFWKCTTQIIEGLFLYILNQNEIIFQEDKSGNAPLLLKTGKVVGKLLSLILALLRLPLPAVTAPLREPSTCMGWQCQWHEDKGWINFEQNAWLAAEASETEVWGIVCKNIKRRNEGKGW